MHTVARRRAELLEREAVADSGALVCMYVLLGTLW